MPSLLEMTRLLALADGRQQVSERLLGQRLREAQAGREQMLAAQAQQRALEQLLVHGQLPGGPISPAALAVHLRQRAVLRRQVAELALECTRLGQQQAVLDAACAAQRLARGALRRKHDKYQMLQQRLARQQRRRQGSLESAEAEDFLLSRGPIC